MAAADTEEGREMAAADADVPTDDSRAGRAESLLAAVLPPARFKGTAATDAAAAALLLKEALPGDDSNKLCAVTGGVLSRSLLSE